MAVSFPRRYAITQRFSLGAPRNFSITPDGTTVLFVRSRSGDDPVHCLWRLDAASGTEVLVCDPETLDGSSGVMTAAEKARRERFRESGGGIVEYSLSADGRWIVFVLNGEIYRVEVGTWTTAQVAGSGHAFDARPAAGSETIVYVSGRDLRATGDALGDRCLLASTDPDESWGSAEFVAAEEMSRRRGWWWNGDGTAVVACQVHTADVPQWWIAAPVNPADAPQPHRYPAAGTTNATVRLWTVDVTTGAAHDLDFQVGPGCDDEYLAAVRWGTRSTITAVTQSRDQRRLRVYDVEPTDGTASLVATETDADWIDLLAGVPAWANGHLVTPTIVDDTITIAANGTTLGRAGFQIREVVKVSDDHAVVLGSADPLDLHVAIVPYDGSDPELLTTAPGVHRAATNGSTMVIVTQTIDAAPVAAIRNGATIASFAEQPDLVPAPSIFAAGDLQVRTAVLLPSDYDGGRLPVLVDPYGGPHAQRVTHARNQYLTSQWFADRGFAVIIADGRGTPGRGAAFERAVKGDLATGVLEDQVTAIDAAAERFDLDLDRVAIRGWSFGGYLSALAVLRRPDRFHAAIAGAPVTDWSLYDTHYTERYLGHPDTHPAAYERTNLCAEASSLVRPLLLIHGLADDNVVAAHTLSLSRALLEAGRPHQVLPLSGVTHMTPQAEVAENLLLLQLRFIVDALGLSTETETDDER